jgi:asparagine synthetase B (glutamine-hydrolysing)
MKTKLFGAFRRIELLDQKQISELFALKQMGNEYFFQDSDYSFQCDQGSVNIFGKVFGLNETFSTLKPEVSTTNPAEAFFLFIRNFGVDSIKNFYGEYTFVYYSSYKIIIGRDLMGGGTPIFYTKDFFSDRLDNFKKIKGFSFEADLESIMTFVHLCHIPSPKTAIKGVCLLAPGDFLIWENGKITVKTFYDFADLYNSYQKVNITIDEAVLEYESLVKKSIRRRIENKNNIGMLISGGFDSGSIAYSTRSIFDGEITGINIGFKDHPLSESPKAKAIADFYKIKFHETSLIGNELNELPKIVEFLDNPFFEVGLILNFIVMKKSKEFNFDVILGGDGSDEMFGGDIKDLAIHHLSKKLFLTPLFALYKELWRFRVFDKNSILFKTQFQNTRLLDPFTFKSFGFNQFEINRLNKSGNKLQVVDYMKGQTVNVKNFDDQYLKAYYYKVFRHDGTEGVVFKASSMSRMFENQLTFPFTDIDIYNFLKKIDREYKITGTFSQILKGNTEPKHLQKKYLRSKLPNTINDRMTQGGFIPLSMFFKNTDDNKMIYNKILSSQFTNDFLDRKEVERFIMNFDKLIQNQKSWFWYKQINSTKLINLLVVNLWWDIHINSKKGNILSEFDK